MTSYAKKEHKPLAHVFKPITLRHKTLKNRIVFGAHTTNMARNGVPGDQQIAYYLERALGGAAMITVEPMPVHQAAVLTRGNFSPCDDAVIPHFSQLTKACKRQGAVMIQQLYHVGAHGDWDNSWHANWSPSGGPSYHDDDGSHAMHEDEITDTIDAFVEAAVRCKKSGFDGVEIWAAYHCLLDQFWTPFSNHRKDKWGGNLENRTRFSREILRRVRAACGEQFIIGLAVNDGSETQICLSREDMVQIIARHDAEELMDYVTVGVGSYFNFGRLIPSFQYAENLGADLSSMLKNRLCHALVIAEANIRTPENANSVLGAKQADLVSIVRGQIADPHLVNKANADRSDEIRRCLSCNQQCWGRRGRDYYISCLVNPSVGHEHKMGGDRYTRTIMPKRVLVIGAGPAGLETARVAAERGHSVVLAEASSQLGGQFRLAGLQPRRGQITDLINWYDRQLDRLEVDVRVNTYVETEDIFAFSADEIVLCTGAMPSQTGFQKARPHQPTLPGIEKDNVWSAEDVLGRSARVGHSVIVLDERGQWRGIGTAWHLANAGHEVTLITPNPMVAQDLQRSATDLSARQSLAKLGTTFIVESAVTEWLGDAVKYACLLTGEITVRKADTLILATGLVANTTLQDELRSKAVDFKIIGDALAPRLAAAAFYEGRKTGLLL